MLNVVSHEPKPIASNLCFNATRPCDTNYLLEMRSTFSQIIK
jgi:hypothetical protein